MSLPPEAVLGALPDATLVVAGGAVVLANPRADALFARPTTGAAVEELLPGGLRDGAERRVPRPDGSEVVVELLLGDADGFTVVTLRDRRGGEVLRVRAHQHAAIAELGQRALAGEGIHALMQEAARTIAAVLEVDLVEVLELLPGRERFAMRGTVGWEQLPFVPVADTQVGLSLDRRAPVVVTDTATERRFGSAELRSAHGVVSGLAVPMIVGGREAGAIGVHSRRLREFSEDDVHFVQAVANVVASALERHRGETELEQASSRLQSVLDASPAAIFLKDLDGCIIVANAAFEQLFGLAPGSAVGRRNSELADADRAASIERRDREVLEADRPLEYEDRIRVGDDERVSLSLMFPLRDAAGRVYGVGGVGTDVTERTRALEDRAALEARLARAERLESVGQLAGGIAHDFNNLLAVIANYAEFIKRSVEPGSRAADDVEQILYACRGATELTRRLLLFSRRRAGNPAVVDLRSVIADTERLLQRTLGEQVELRTAVDPGLSHVLADRGQLEQVLMNLSINARDAMPDGGVLTIEAADVDGDVRITVSDTGAGMPEEVLDRAFEPFFSTKPAGEGTGLGLATVYGIVRGAGGTVELRSGEGNGTVVVVQLPATRDAVPAEADAAEAGPEPGRGEQVLLVEDKEAVRVLSERILADGGYAVLSAADAAEAMELHGSHGPAIDALITDVVMPGLSGRDLADELRSRRPGLPVVFVSGYADDHVVEDARRDGATAFVEKPFTADELLAAVRSVLDDT